MYCFLVVVSFVVISSVTDCLERSVSLMTCYVSASYLFMLALHNVKLCTILTNYCNEVEIIVRSY